MKSPESPVYCYDTRDGKVQRIDNVTSVAALLEQRATEARCAVSTGSARLPKEIRDRIYKPACLCKCTEEQAQKEPCLCPAYGLVDQIEDWANELLPNIEHDRTRRTDA